jgi:chloramphenicol-sensitive protein RarD
MRYGLFLAIGAYSLWGILPLYFRLLHSIPALEILSYRIVFSFLTLLPLLCFRKNLFELGKQFCDIRGLGLLAIGALLISTNWGFYVYVVNHDLALQASLGYYINPLVNVMIGLFIFKERFRRMQWLAVIIAAVAVVLFALEVGCLPYWSFILAFTFAGYGIVHRYNPTRSMIALFIETLMMLPIALLFLHYVGSVGKMETYSTPLIITIAVSGLITVIPLLLFSGAARRIPFSTLGLCQYISPTGQFLCAVIAFQEPMLPLQWVCFALIWIALILLSYDSIRNT